ncbi:MAG: hypothetical protein EBQ92_00525, partial [Proteobacteria bacterium]|nr:hypothetical protein [Pseudomonadota bacterium]
MKPVIDELLANAKSMYDKIIRLRYNDIRVDQIVAVGNEWSDRLANEGAKGKITMSINIPYLGWRTGSSTEIGDNVAIYDYTEYDSWYGKILNKYPYSHNTVLPMADIYIYQYKPKPKVGKANVSDTHCFYDCLKYLYADKLVMGLTAIEFKKYFRIKLNDGVHIKHIPKIEKQLNMRIDIIGDHLYTSTSKAEKGIKLLLKDGHYSVVPNKMPHPKEWSKKERTPISFMRSQKIGDECMICYDGEKTFEMTTKKFWNEYRKKGLSKYIFLKQKVENKNMEDLQVAHFQFTKHAYALKEATDGRINMFKTGLPKSTADNLLYKLTKNLNIDFEPVQQDEAEFIEGCYNGGVIKRFANSGDVFEKLHKYDYCSKYPSIMTSPATFPVKRGEFKIVSDELKNKKYLPKGIYRCKVIGSSKLFVFNSKNYYTNHELNEAMNRFNLKLEFIEDGKPNMLEYTADKCVSMRSIFGEYIKLVFPLKQQGLEYAKAILTVPWGSVCQKNRIKKIFKMGKKKNLNLPEDEYLEIIKTVSENYISVETEKKDKLYIGIYPRLLPFLTAFCRIDIYELLQNKIDHVKLILTDGFLVDHDTYFDKIQKQNAKLGQLVYEGYYKNFEFKQVNSSYKDIEFVKY